MTTITNSAATAVKDINHLLDGIALPPIELRSYTIGQLIGELETMRTKKRETTKQLDAADNELRATINDKTISEWKEVRKLYDPLTERISHLQAVIAKQKLAIEGINGALKVCVAHALKDKLAMLFAAQTSTRRVGEKTERKFLDELAECCEGVKYVSYGDWHKLSVTLDTTNGYDNLYLWLTDALVRDGAFNTACTIQLPTDSYNLMYPVDWYAWAEVVQTVNEYNERKFKEYVVAQDALRVALETCGLSMWHISEHQFNKR